MTDVDTIIKVEVIDKLKTITIANGSLNDVTILDGYLVHYAHDLLNNVNGLTFPAVAVQPLDDSPNPDSTQTKSINSRTMRLIGTVSVKEPSLVNQNLNSLLLDVRKVLAFNTYGDFKRNSKMSELNIGNAIFNLPDSKDEYAFFEMDITIKYTENWK